MFSDEIYAFVIALSTLATFAVVRYTTKWGLEHIAVGMNDKSAVFAGINIIHKKIVAFIVSSVLTSLAALVELNAISYGGWSPKAGIGIELQAIAAAVIGGCSITGGVFYPFAAALAAVLWVSVAELSLRIPYGGTETQRLITGILLLLVAFITHYRSQQPV
jgi:ribose/xylose/arabinose/galactoside ABC-type transport system permease subunit